MPANRDPERSPPRRPRGSPRYDLPRPGVYYKVLALPRMANFDSNFRVWLQVRWWRHSGRPIVTWSKTKKGVFTGRLTFLFIIFNIIQIPMRILKNVSMRFLLWEKIRKKWWRICHANHVFGYNFLSLRFLQKACLRLKKNVFSFDLLQKTEGSIFSFREKLAFPYVPEVKFYGDRLVEIIVTDIAALSRLSHPLTYASKTIIFRHGKL